MRLGQALFVPVVGLIALVWWWLGWPVAMPTSPVDSGDKLYCVSYAPFRGHQTPLDLTTRIDPAQIDDDLARLAKVTNCVRTYSVDLGLDRIAEIAGRHGLKVLQGIWLGSNPERNQIEIARAVELARQHPDVIRAVVVGNEVLLRGEMSSGDLASIIRNVKAQVPVPVTYADVWEFWLRHREIEAAVDFITIHILPYWEDFPVSAKNAGAHVHDIRQKVAAAFPGREILIGEVGWPSAGRMRDGALPSPANQAYVLHEVLALAKRENYRVNLIESFDQPWKRQLEGTVGGHWGLLDATTREPKFIWGQPVSNHSGWAWQAAAGIALAMLVHGAALMARRRRQRDSETWTPWVGVAAVAAGSGIMIGWALAAVPVESLGMAGWARSLALVALAILSPVLAAMAIIEQRPIPAFATVLQSGKDRDPWTVALGLVLVGLTVMAILVALGLVFDPRYRDFPFAALTAAAVPFAIVSALSPSPSGRHGRAEWMSAAVLAVSAVYIAFNETFANWQSLWVCGLLLVLAVTLVRVRDAQG